MTIGINPLNPVVKFLRDKPLKDAKVIKGKIKKISFGDGLLRAYQLKKAA